ncbi:MAG: cytochrome d ubiquinol oxidase subunit II [Calditrichaeota bacterium]|nr:cytochrome d ubiquinol oxidase subunit II [Calditrichota bacterium]
MSALQVSWFFLIGLLLTVYAILDGFDLGAGIWHLFARKDEHRRSILNAIGPVWDGNEVWLLTGGGALFAAFPHVYATVFSGFYLALMLVLFALIFRAVSIEFRSKRPSARWRSTWDTAFSVGSIVPALLFGVAVGNILRGLPLDESKNFTGGFFDLLNPYALLIGLLGFAMLATHGALYLALKTEEEVAESAKGWSRIAWPAYFVLFILTGVVTIFSQPRLLENYAALPILWIFPLFALAMMLAIAIFQKKGKDGKAFLASSLSIFGVCATAAADLFPNLVPALDHPEWSLTIMNSSSSALTLGTMLILALVGMPIVIGYTIWVYRTFRGKVKVETDLHY